MKRLLFSVFTALLLTVGTAWANTVDDGSAAYKRRGDYTESVRLQRLSAAQGNWRAQYKLGDMYFRGESVAQNYTEAVKWYRLAAAQGDFWSQYVLGVMYEKGQGVAQDYAEAIKWYRLVAAREGNAGGLVSNAQYSVGLMYAKTQDYAEAVKWYRLAATQGDAVAQFSLGVMYEKGEGVVQNYVRAHMWLNVSAASGYAREVVAHRDIVAKKMTSQQIAEAQKMAIECQQKNFKGCE